MHARRTPILAAIEGLTFGLTAGRAQALPDPTPILGAGNDTCLEWVTHHRSHDARSEQENQWLGGYLSGYNTFYRMGKTSKRIFFETELDLIPGAIFGYCERHPREKVSSALFGFVDRVIHPGRRR